MSGAALSDARRFGGCFRGRARSRGGAPPRGVRPSRAGASSDVGPAADASSYRVLAFEDSYKIRAMLDDANVRYAHFEQRWTSENAVEALEAFGRVDVLMLDFYLPPVTGLEVLRQVNDAARAGRIERPKHILGMSSVMSCNARLVAEGADAGFVKWDVGTWSGWAK